MDDASPDDAPLNDAPRHRFDTLQLHAGQPGADPTTGARAVPIYATSSYVFRSAQHAADVFAGEGEGSQYGRMDNPTVDVFVDRIVALEGGKAGVGFSSGQAATTTTLLALAGPGKHIVFSREVFGGTYSVVRKLLEPWGCAWDAVDQTVDAIAAALRPETVAVWVENIANPTCTVPDMPAIAALCRERRIPFIVDNTWGCGGYICRPLELGADLVVHSATKWIGGHGTFIGGAVVDGGTFDWDHPNFPAFSRPDARGRSYLSREPETPFRLRAHELGLSTMGMTLSPFSAFLGLQGLATLSLRVDQECSSALELARWLEGQPTVSRVHYPGLESHPSHDLAKQMLRNGFGAVLSFETKEEAGAARFVDRIRVASHLANIGDARTVAILPWFTTHSGLDEPARRAAGITPGLVRLSVGLEGLEDLRADLEQALRP